jgi:Galactose mutarotase and related enzymes
MVFWPYNFCFEKQFSITEKQLTITFILTSEKNMPFMLGFHPAFLLSNTGKEVVVSKIKTANLDAVYTAGHNALPFLNTDAVTLKHTNKPNITIQTTNF